MADVVPEENKAGELPSYGSSEPDRDDAAQDNITVAKKRRRMEKKLQKRTTSLDTTRGRTMRHCVTSLTRAGSSTIRDMCSCCGSSAVTTSTQDHGERVRRDTDKTGTLTQNNMSVGIHTAWQGHAERGVGQRHERECVGVGGQQGAQVEPEVVPGIVVMVPGDEGGVENSVFVKNRSERCKDENEDEEGDAYEATLDERQRVFGTNVLPMRKMRSLLAGTALGVLAPLDGPVSLEELTPISIEMRHSRERAITSAHGKRNP
ncbi:hypothetical protein B0H21DRAFT_825785 [Amylocystis lapponica]|nr:hypothetical protein B0H21DRAFT_825785 [Amylocystis lapponica]